MCVLRLALTVTVLVFVRSQELEDFGQEFGSDEVMIAQETGNYRAIVRSPINIVKPTGETNSHRPQYNQDSMESDASSTFETTTQKALVKNYRSSTNLRAKERVVKDTVLKILERKDHVGKLRQMLPFIRTMSESQKMALASLVASQIAEPTDNPFNFAQVRQTFNGKSNATSDLMLPILLDMADLVKSPKTNLPPQAQMLRRSDDGDTYFDGEVDDSPFEVNPVDNTPRNRIRRIPQSIQATNATIEDKTEHNETSKLAQSSNSRNLYSSVKREENDRTTTKALSTTERTASSTSKTRSNTISRSLSNNSTASTLDLIADSTNHSLAQDLPVAEKLRAVVRYNNKGVTRRGTYPPKLPSVPKRTAETTVSAVRRRPPIPVRKIPSSVPEIAKCELFTNTLCLHADDYPTEAIINSIRRNKAAASALLADFKDPGEGALDGITAAQEAKYTAERYPASNRRGDTGKEFASAGEAGFMCPSMVKYARPQRARATSGQWKYIVNTGEHTQTLRLEKCLKPKETCTYLTDNFKSKCVQVYNYHRLLTWDQQNGLHMDIFKVPTCCSCHIEGYSISFPPLGHRIQESSSESFPGEDLSSEHGNHAFESVQSTVKRPTINKSPFSHRKPLETFPPYSDTQNLISGQPYSKIIEEEGTVALSNPIDSYGNTYLPDSFNQASSVKNVKRQPARNFFKPNLDSVTLPSYLEPPTPLATSTFVKDTSYKFNNANTFKRGSTRNRQRPIRKKISGGPEDLASSETLTVESFTSSTFDSNEDQNDYIDQPERGRVSVVNTANTRVTIGPKLQSFTTERHTMTQKTVDSEEKLKNGQKINYNYHPIIDFFEENDKNESIDREDNEGSYTSLQNSEWHPINHLSRNTQNHNLDRKKQK